MGKKKKEKKEKQSVEDGEEVQVRRAAAVGGGGQGGQPCPCSRPHRAGSGEWRSPHLPSRVLQLPLLERLVPNVCRGSPRRPFGGHAARGCPQALGVPRWRLHPRARRR